MLKLERCNRHVIFPRKRQLIARRARLEMRRKNTPVMITVHFPIFLIGIDLRITNTVLTPNLTYMPRKRCSAEKRRGPIIWRTPIITHVAKKRLGAAYSYFNFMHVGILVAIRSNHRLILRNLERSPVNLIMQLNITGTG